MRVWLVLLILITVVAIGAVLVLAVPQTGAAADHAEDYVGDRDPGISWRCPSGAGHVTERLELDIAVDDLRSSMDRAIMRQRTLGVPVPSLLVDPDDPFVRTVADHIRSAVHDPNDLAAAALAFVQTGIRYESDQTVYGTREFWAAPVETLFCKAGDCEDKVVLLCSIYGALGIDCVIMRYSGHEAVGLVQGKSIAVCETTCSTPVRPGTGSSDPLIDIYRPDDGFGAGGIANRMLAGFRNLIHAALGLRIPGESS